MPEPRVKFEVLRGVEGPCLCLSLEGASWGRRIAGPKPWGGGTVVQSFTVDLAELRSTLDKIAPSSPTPAPLPAPEPSAKEATP